MRNQLAATLLASLCLSASAGTYTWTGAADDGLFFTAGNWDYDDGAGTVTSPAASAPARNTTDDIVIGNGDAVSYVPGGDWEPKGSTTISNGSSITQVNGNSWPRIQGPLLLDGGSYDTGSAGTFRLGVTMTIRNGGVFTLRCGQQNTDNAGRIVLGNGGSLVRTGAWPGTIPVTFAGGTMTVPGVYTSNAADLYEGGAIDATGEFHPVNGVTIDGTAVKCSLYAPQAADCVVTFESGSLECTGTGYDGFYQNAGVYIDIAAGSTATFTMPVAAASVYTAYFANGKFLLDGATVSADDFADLFTVEEVDATHARFQLANAAPTYAFGATAAASVTASSATVSATLRKLGEDAGTVVVAWAASAAAIDLAHGESLGAATPAGAVFSKTITGLTEEVEVFYAFGVLVDGEVVAQSDVGSFIPSSYTAVFTGAAGTEDWATAGNWRSGSVPTDADTIRIDADCTRTGNLNLQDWDITVNGAAFTSTGEITPGPRTVRDGSITATVFVAGGVGNAIIVRGSDVIGTTTGRWGAVPRGFYGADPHFDFRSGAPCTYTYNWDPEGTAPDFETEFRAVFVNGKILVDSAALTIDDTNRVSFVVDDEAYTATFTLLETVVSASFASAASAATDGLATTLSATVEVSGGKPLYVLVGTNATDLVETLVAATAADATTYTFAMNGVEGTLYHYQFRLGAADDPNSVLDSAIPQTFFSSAAGNLWTGNANEHANDARNWSKGTVPGAADRVYVIQDVARSGTMQWDLENATVAGWVQIGERVNFHTNPSNVLTVAGDVSLSGGANWTHLGPSETPETIVNVAVGGDLTLAADSVIQAGTVSDAAGRQSRGYTRGCGPGYLREAGGSHAGDGGHIPSATSFVSYGSILDPLSWGSGGWGNGDQYAGGGVVKLVVGGTLTVDGTIASRGFGYPLDGEETIGGAGSGGSVNITAGALAGSGAIDANGGNNGLYGPGSGGRVKIALTGAGEDFSDFTGTIEALGGSMQNQTQADTWDISPAAAGTVCLSLAGEEPVVKVHNVWRYGNNEAAWRVATDTNAVPSGTHLPAKQDADSAESLKTTHWELAGHGAIRLTANTKVASLTLADDGTQCVYTDGHTLRVNTLTVGDRSIRSRQTAETLPGIVFGDGEIVVGDPATLVLFR